MLISSQHMATCERCAIKALCLCKAVAVEAAGSRHGCTGMITQDSVCLYCVSADLMVHLSI